MFASSRTESHSERMALLAVVALTQPWLFASLGHVDHGKGNIQNGEAALDQLGQLDIPGG